MNAQIALETFRKEPLITIQLSTLVMEAQELARKNGIHHLPILRANRVVGMVCTCDLLLCPGDIRVDQVMKEPVMMSISSEVKEAAEVMQRTRVGSVLLMEGSAPVGIVTRGDVFEKAKHIAAEADLPSCACCGVKSHLRPAVQGRIYCVFCASTVGVETERARARS